MFYVTLVELGSEDVYVSFGLVSRTSPSQCEGLAHEIGTGIVSEIIFTLGGQVLCDTLLCIMSTLRVVR